MKNWELDRGVCKKENLRTIHFRLGRETAKFSYNGWDPCDLHDCYASSWHWGDQMMNCSDRYSLLLLLKGTKQFIWSDRGWQLDYWDVFPKYPKYAPLGSIMANLRARKVSGCCFCWKNPGVPDGVVPGIFLLEQYTLSLEEWRTLDVRGLIK